MRHHFIMGDVLVFNPETEFQVLEEFEFDELIQRPEQVRFFTLGEQTTDLFDKLLPKTGKVGKNTLRKVENEVQSFKKLYTAILREIPSGFEEITGLRPTHLPWVQYANSNERSLTSYNWNQKWLPMYEQDRGIVPNYYVQMLDSLPKSGIYYSDGNKNVVYPATVNGVISLSNYVYTKTAYREDGTFRIQSIPRPDTQDVASFTGYIIEKPEPPPPTPLDGHPFLGLRESAVTIDTDEDLPTVLPSIEAIFQHGVPRTSNPYKDAPPYLKLYDIQLRSVPWSVWRENFPPVELVESVPPLEIPSASSETDAPSKVLSDVYKTPWYPGLATRKWLITQLDGGSLVGKILLSQAGNLGPLAIPPPVLLPDVAPIEGTAEDCLPSYITDFEDFAGRGIFRFPKCAKCGFIGHGASVCPDKKETEVVKAEYQPGFGCVPLAFVSKEREEAPFHNKQAWEPGTDTSILQNYQKLISTYTEKHVEVFSEVPPAPPVLPPSETRELIVAILADDDRLPEDKVEDIQVLLDDVEHDIVKHLYRQTDTSQFLICEHTLEKLGGEFEKDAEAFLRKWSVVDAGFRICQYCGERIVDIIQDQDQFDEHGRLIQRKSKLGKDAINDEHITFAASLKKLKSLFNNDSPSEDVFYLLLSLLQVLPEEDQLKPILDYIRSETSKVNQKIAGKKLTTKQTSDINFALSVFGFNATVILLQTHRPQLLPRRTFGSKPLVLRGYPRDTDDVADAPLIDSLISVLYQTFESYPTTFRGSSIVLMRNILNDKKSVKKVVLSSLAKQFIPTFRQKLQKVTAKVDVTYSLHNTFEPAIVRPTTDVTYLAPSDHITEYSKRFRCKQLGPPWLAASTPFSFRQSSIAISDPLKPSSKAQELRKIDTPTPEYIPVKDEVRTKIRRKVPDFKPLTKVLEHDNPEFLRSVLLEWMVIIGESSTATPDIRKYIRETRSNVEYAIEDPSLLRDYFKGILVEFVTLIVSDVTLKADIERAASENLTIRSLFAVADESKKTTDTLRAREREEFKERMRRLPDAQREITKMLIDRGLAAYLITKDDREVFLKEMQEKLERETVPQQDEEVPPEQMPDEGLNVERFTGAQGEVPEVDGQELQTDYGDYGDAPARNAEGEEFNDNVAFDDAVGF